MYEFEALDQEDSPLARAMQALLNYDKESGAYKVCFELSKRLTLKEFKGQADAQKELERLNRWVI